MTFLRAKTIHFTGIKGVGMTALAGMALDLKKRISGSDIAEIFPTDAWLKQAGIRVRTGFSPNNLPAKLDFLVFTGAHGGRDNPEVKAAVSRKVPVVNYAQALAQAAGKKELLATAGVGGKSTTAAMLATVLETAKTNSSWAVGAGNFWPLGRPGHYCRRGRWLVAETDEFVSDPNSDLTPKFHYLRPLAAIITNLEHDHPDIYQSLNDVYASFTAFAERVPAEGAVLVNLDNPRVRAWIKTLNRPVITFGFSPRADWQIINSYLAEEKQFFSLRYREMVFDNLILSQPGQYNLLNAAAAYAAGNWLGLEPKQLAAGIKAYAGAKRRFELIAEVNRIRLYDDYAHHPSEIEAVLKAARDWLPGRRLIAVFQSHTYSRTKALLPQFVRSLAGADVVLINEIFASARESDTLGISGEGLAREIKARHPAVYFTPGEAATVSQLKKLVIPGDAIFTLGAGNNWLWHRSIIKILKQK